MKVKVLLIVLCIFMCFFSDDVQVQLGGITTFASDPGQDVRQCKWSDSLIIPISAMI